MLHGGEGSRERLDGGERGGEGRCPTSPGWRGRVWRWLKRVGSWVHLWLLGGWKWNGCSMMGYLVLRLVGDLRVGMLWGTR